MQKLKTTELVSLTPPRRILNKTRVLLLAALMGSSLLLVGINGVMASNGDSQNKTIHATGSTSAIIVSVMADKTVGGYEVTTRSVLNTYTGTLSGTSNILQQLAANLATGISEGTSTGTFAGTLGDLPPGSFSTIALQTGDRSGCPCPPGVITFTTTFVVVAGTGQGGLAGICGGGTSFGSGDAVHGFTTTYDYTFEFGDRCHSQG
jgi:hypothetical protein